MNKKIILLLITLLLSSEQAYAKVKEDKALDKLTKRPSPAQISTQTKPVTVKTLPSSPAPFVKQTTMHKDMSIFGEPMILQEQAVAFIKSVAPHAKLNCSIEEIVALYYKETKKEGIRGDVALAQALVETGFFQYGGTVLPEQNNYCGLGTTSSKVKGAYFPTPEIGVRAHIQHLLVYSAQRMPKEKIVDPRFSLVQKMPHLYGTARQWMDLDGRWATAPNYGQKILAIHNRMNNFTNFTPAKPTSIPQENIATEQNSFLDRINAILESER